MKIRILLFLLIVISYSSCHSDYKVCEYDIKNPQLKIYNDILNELIEHRFYNRYFGKNEEKIFEEYASENADTSKIRKMSIEFQNELFNDTINFCNIYLDTLFRHDFGSLSYYQNDTGKFAKEIKREMLDFSSNLAEVIDSLNNMQSQYSASDFHLCTSRILSLKEIKQQNDRCEIGIISFSKLFLDKSNTKGLLYYNFRCGGLCGRGELLFIEKGKDKWKINKAIMFWIS